MSTDLGQFTLLVRTNQSNLKRAMQWLGVTYTRRFNDRHSKSGHLFQGRYKSILIQNDAYIMRLSCYIHRNPLRAGIVSRLIDYKWSSYPIYAYGEQEPDYLSTQMILSYFKGAKKHKQYRQKVQKYADEEKSLLEDLRHGIILGSKVFVDKIRKRFLPDVLHLEIPQQKKIAKDFQLKDIIKKAAKILQVDIDKCIDNIGIESIIYGSRYSATA